MHGSGIEHGTPCVRGIFYHRASAPPSTIWENLFHIPKAVKGQIDFTSSANRSIIAVIDFCSSRNVEFDLLRIARPLAFISQLKTELFYSLPEFDKTASFRKFVTLLISNQLIGSLKPSAACLATIPLSLSLIWTWN